MLNRRFKDLGLLLSVAKLALIEAEEHARDVRLVLAHDPANRKWGLSLEGDYPKDSERPTLSYEMLFTIDLDDIKIPDDETQAEYMKRLVGRGCTMAESAAALQELRHTPLLTIDPRHPPPVPERRVYRSISVG